MSKSKISVEVLGKRLELLEMKVDKLKTMDEETLNKRIHDIEKKLFTSKDVLTTEEAAQYLDISYSLLYKLTYTGEIPHYKPRGKMVYFDKAELNDWMRQGRNVPTKNKRNKTNNI